MARSPIQHLQEKRDEVVGKKILVIDDEPTALRLISYTLQKEGYEVLTANRGGEGLALAREARPDLVLLDVMMPDLSGYDVSRRLRSDAVTARIPIIMLTAKGQVTDKVAGFRAGADDYVVKPVDPSELAARVTAVLSRASTTSEKKARVIAMIGAKGGVGTTTFAVNVGIHLARLGRVTTLCEMHGDFGTAAAQLGLRPRMTLARLFEDGASRPVRDPESAIVVHTSGLRLLSAPQKHGEFFQPQPPQVTSVIQALAATTDVLLLDLPSGMSAARRACLEQSQFITVVTEQDPISLACARELLQCLKENVATPGLGALIVHRSRSVSELTALQIAGLLDVGILGVVPTAQEECLVSARSGFPFVLCTTPGPAASALIQAAERLAQEPVVLERF